MRAALGVSLLFTKGLTEDECAKWAETIELAKQLNDCEHLLNGYIVMWGHQVRQPNAEDALAIARQCEELVKQIGDPSLLPMTDWMLGHSQRLLGCQATAQEHLQRALKNDTLKQRRDFYSRYGYARRIDALGVLSNSLWI